MFPKSRFKLLFYSLGIIVILITILILFSNTLLSKHCPINAKILVIEGWLPVNELENINKLTDVSKYQEIIITGLTHKTWDSEELKYHTTLKELKLPTTLYYNSIILIDNKRINKLQLSDSLLNLSIFASGTEAQSRNAHFSVFLNSTCIGNTFTEKSQKNFKYLLHLKGISAKNIMICYNNDFCDKSTDRNLIVDSIALNQKIIKNKLFITTTSELDEAYRYFPFHSSAQFASCYLTSMGICKKFTVLDTFYEGRNKTYIGTKKLFNYLKQKYNYIPSINLISIDGHSRRSYIACKTVLGRNASIGIISYKDTANTETAFQKSVNHRNEYFKLFISYLVFAFSR